VQQIRHCRFIGLRPFTVKSANSVCYH
jgi:hypothetical protein